MKDLQLLDLLKYTSVSRRAFLKGALAAGGALALAGCEKDPVTNTVAVTENKTVTVTDKQTVTVTDTKTVTVVEPFAGESAGAQQLITTPSMLVPNYTDCTGCRYCVYACTEHHYQEYCLNKSNIQVFSLHARGGVVDIPILCMKCDNSPCMDVCPDKVAAISIDEVTGARIIDHEKCTLCGLCIDACADRGVGCLRMSNEEDRIVGMCDMCGGNPKCVEICPENLFNIVPKAAADTFPVNSLFVEKPEVLADRVAEIIFTV